MCVSLLDGLLGGDDNVVHDRLDVVQVIAETLDARLIAEQECHPQTTLLFFFFFFFFF